MVNKNRTVLPTEADGARQRTDMEREAKRRMELYPPLPKPTHRTPKVKTPNAAAAYSYDKTDRARAGAQTARPAYRNISSICQPSTPPASPGLAPRFRLTAEEKANIERKFNMREPTASAKNAGRAERANGVETVSKNAKRGGRDEEWYRMREMAEQSYDKGNKFEKTPAKPTDSPDCTAIKAKQKTDKGKGYSNGLGRPAVPVSNATRTIEAPRTPAAALKPPVAPKPAAPRTPHWQVAPGPAIARAPKPAAAPKPAVSRAPKPTAAPKPAAAPKPVAQPRLAKSPRSPKNRKSKAKISTPPSSSPPSGKLGDTFSPTSRCSSKAVRDWVSRRLGKLHKGEPKLKCDQDEFTESQTLRGPNGSFGSIFMSERIEDGLPVVLKMLKQDERSSESEILLEICMHEVFKTCSSIVSYHGSFKTSNTHYALVLDRYNASLEGWLGGSSQETLEQVVSRQASADFCARWSSSRQVAAQGLLAAVAHMHKVNVMHRDIKPANLLLKTGEIVDRPPAPIEQAVLTDLGFAAYMGSDDTAPGTVRYMAPEMLCGEEYNESVDIWAVGMTLIELWSGEEPMGYNLSDIEFENFVCDTPELVWEGRSGRVAAAEGKDPNQKWKGGRNLLEGVPMWQKNIAYCLHSDSVSRPKAKRLQDSCRSLLGRNVTQFNM